MISKEGNVILSKRLVQGLGVNDADYPVTRRAFVKGSVKIVWTCPYYQKWKNMLNRCSEKFILNNPTYKGVTVSEFFISFMNFRSWCVDYENTYKVDIKGCVLDKDILKNGNKRYSPRCCVLIPPALNNLLVKPTESGNLLPTGVFKDKQLFVSTCRNPFGKKYYQSFSSEKEAERFYLCCKNVVLDEYISRGLLTDSRVIVALRLLFKEPVIN